MSRIEGVLKALKGQGRKALIPYITAGDPHPDVTVDLMHTLVEAGADITELGVPFSDPVADGPVTVLYTLLTPPTSDAVQLSDDAATTTTKRLIDVERG